MMESDELTILIAILLMFLEVTLLTLALCYAFDIIFSWKLVLGVWAIYTLIKDATHNSPIKLRRKQ